MGSISLPKHLSKLYTFDTVRAIANFLLAETKLRPKVGIICGSSGLSELSAFVTEIYRIPYSKIPHFPTTPASDCGTRFEDEDLMIFGYIEGVPVVLLQSRFRYYQGYSLAQCAMPVRVLKLMGCEFVLTTSAGGAINAKFRIGDIMLIYDHVDFFGITGLSPLLGPNEERFGSRFLTLRQCYDPELLQIARDAAKQMDIEDILQEGVVTGLAGPSYESVSEARMFRKFGIDAVCMSTIYEVIFARHCNLRVFAFCLITNKCALDFLHSSLSTENIARVDKERNLLCGQFIMRVIRGISDILKNPKPDEPNQPPDFLFDSEDSPDSQASVETEKLQAPASCLKGRAHCPLVTTANKAENNPVSAQAPPDAQVTQKFDQPQEPEGPQTSQALPTALQERRSVKIRDIKGTNSFDNGQVSQKAQDLQRSQMDQTLEDAQKKQNTCEVPIQELQHFQTSQDTQTSPMSQRIQCPQIAVLTQVRQILMEEPTSSQLPQGTQNSQVSHDRRLIRNLQKRRTSLKRPERDPKNAEN